MAYDVVLQYYRNQKVFEGSIELEKTGGVVEDEKISLSSILDRLNERFGTDFKKTDLLSRDQVKEDMLNSEDI